MQQIYHQVVFDDSPLKAAYICTHDVIIISITHTPKHSLSKHMCTYVTAHTYNGSGNNDQSPL